MKRYIVIACWILVVSCQRVPSDGDSLAQGATPNDGPSCPGLSLHAPLVFEVTSPEPSTYATLDTSLSRVRARKSIPGFVYNDGSTWKDCSIQTDSDGKATGFSCPYDDDFCAHYHIEAQLLGTTSGREIECVVSNRYLPSESESTQEKLICSGIDVTENVGRTHFGGRATVFNTDNDGLAVETPVTGFSAILASKLRPSTDPIIPFEESEGHASCKLDIDEGVFYCGDLPENTIPRGRYQLDTLISSPVQCPEPWQFDTNFAVARAGEPINFELGCLLGDAAVEPFSVRLYKSAGVPAETGEVVVRGVGACETDPADSSHFTCPRTPVGQRTIEAKISSGSSYCEGKAVKSHDGTTQHTLTCGTDFPYKSYLPAIMR